MKTYSLTFTDLNFVSKDNLDQVELLMKTNLEKIRIYKENKLKVS